MIKEFDPVVLTENLPENGLEAGDVGWIVMIHGDSAGYEVTMPADAVRPVLPDEIAHVRKVA